MDKHGGFWAGACFAFRDTKSQRSRPRASGLQRRRPSERARARRSFEGAAIAWKRGAAGFRASIRLSGAIGFGRSARLFCIREESAADGGSLSSYSMAHLLAERITMKNGPNHTAEPASPSRGGSS